MIRKPAPWPLPLSADHGAGSPHRPSAQPCTCQRCGQAARYIGKLPQIGRHPLVMVYYCDRCGHMVEHRPTELIAPGW